MRRNVVFAQNVMVWLLLAGACGWSASSRAAESKTFSISGASITLDDFSTELDVYFRSMRFNRAQQLWNVEVVISNRTSEAISGPFVLQVTSTTGTTAGNGSADGVQEGKPFFDLSTSIPSGLLAGGQASSPRTISLALAASGARNPATLRFARAPHAGLAFTRTLDGLGLPLPNVTVFETGPNGTQGTRTLQSDPQFGIVTLGQVSGLNTWKFEADGFEPVWRQALIPTTGVLVVPNPRLVVRSALVSGLPPGPGMEVSAGGVQAKFSVGAGGVTPLTAQTLPLPLPTGWSPLQAFWAESQPDKAITVNATPWGSIGGTDVAAWVKLDTNQLSWRVVQVVAGNGAKSVAGSFDGSGAYVLVVGDTGASAPPKPVAGNPLPPSATASPASATFTASGSVTPDTSPATSTPELVTGTAAVVFSNTLSAPSGQIFRTMVGESYTMNNSTRRITPQYETFITAYQRPGDQGSNKLQATFPIRPLLLLGADQLDEAVVRVDVLGDIAFTGSVIDQSGGELSANDLRLIAPQGIFSRPEAIYFRAISPTNINILDSLSNVVVAAFELGSPPTAQTFVLRAPPQAPNSSFVLARIVARNGVYGYEPVERFTSDAAGNLRSNEPATGDRLSGLNGAGLYLLVEVEQAQGLVLGTARSSSGNTQGDLLVRLDPWLTFSDSNGAYKLLAPTGSVTVAATDLRTGDIGRSNGSVPGAGPPLVLNVSVSSSGPVIVETAPKANASGVARVSAVLVTFSESLDPSTVDTNAISLIDAKGQVVPTGVSLNLQGTTATVLPVNPLAASTLYRVLVSTNIADHQSRKLEGTNQFSFTTESDFLNRTGGEFVTFEPTNGLARVSGSAGTADGGATVTLVNDTTGVTTTVIARADGSFDSSIDANTDDQLSAVLINSNGTRTTIPASKRILADGSVVLFGSGGVVRATGELGDVEIKLDPGSVPGQSVLRLNALTSAQMNEVLNNTQPKGGRAVGQGFVLSMGGDRVRSSPHVSLPVLDSQLDLAPGEKPEDASFALAAVTKIGGVISYCVVDTMHYAAGKLVTSSPPFPGPDFQNGGPKNLSEILSERGVVQSPVASFVDTNQTFGELSQLAANLSTINEGVAHQLQIDDSFTSKAVLTVADFANFVGSFLPQVQLSQNLFAISYAPIQMARSRKVTVTGRVMACVIDASGNCNTNLLRPVVGAVVTLHQLGAHLQFEVGRIPEGLIYTLTDGDGRYALVTDNTAAPLNDTNAFGVMVSATHPRFFGQRPVQGVQLSAVQNTYRADLFFADTDFNQPSKVPPFIAVSHTPSFPATGQVARVTVRATQGSTRPTITKPVVAAVTPLVPGAKIDPLDVSINGPVDTDNSADRSAAATFEIKSARALTAILAIEASTGDSGPRQVGYEISFGGDSPPDSGEIKNSDPNDKEPPRVARTSPGPKETLGMAQPLLVEFNEPIRKDVTSHPDAVQLDPAAGTPALTLNDDQRTLEIRFPKLEPGTSYTLSLQSSIADLAGNPLDPNDPTATLHFKTAQVLNGNLPGIEMGSGLAIQGKYAFALDRGSSPALISYDITDPTAPVQVQKLSLGVPYRDLVLIPEYSFVLKPGDQPRTAPLLVLLGGDFTSFFDDRGNISFGGQYLRVYDVSSPKNMQRIAARRISASYGAATKVVWSPPLLAYLNSSADFQEIGVVNLQSFIIGSNLSPDQLAALPQNPVEGLDKNGDGDFVDPGETLPLPGQIQGEFAGKIESFSLDDTAQRIQDFSFDAQNGDLSVILGSGNTVLLNGGIGAPLGPSYRTIVAAGQPIRRQDRALSNFPITEGRPKRVFMMLSTSLPTTNGVVTGDFALVSVVPDSGATFNGLIILDTTDVLNVKEIGKVPIDPADGLAQSVRPAGGGLLALSTSANVFLLDPSRLLQPSGPTGGHPSIVSKVPGAGSGSFTTAATDFGLYGNNLGTKSVLVQSSPIIAFAYSVDTNAVLNVQKLDGSHDAGQKMFDKLRTTSSLVPARFRAATNNGEVLVQSSLTPPAPQSHYYVLVFAPGGAGPKITLALESLNASGHPLLNKGAGFPLVSALDSTTRHDLGADLRTKCDLTGDGLIAFRLSTNELSPLYNVYLSKPFALTYEGMSQTDLDKLRNDLDREVLWSGHFMRASLDPVMKDNPVLKKFASVSDTDSGQIQAIAAAVAESLPADYIMGPNPAPVEGAAAVPGTYGSVAAHNGEFQADATDFTLPSPRMPIQFRRHIGGQDLFDGPFGRGWDFNYNQRLAELSGGVFLPGMKMPLIIRGQTGNEIGGSKDVLFYSGEGRTILYQYAGSTKTNGYTGDVLLDSLGFLGKATGFYLPPEGVFDVLMRFADGRFVRVEPDGTQTWYSARGRLEKIQDRYPKNHIVFDYSDRGELNRIRDLSVDVDRYLEIGYWRKTEADFQSDRPDKRATNNASIGKICTLRDYTQRKVDFSYDDCGRLLQRLGIEVTQGGANPLQFIGREVTTYNYGDTFEGANDVRGVVYGTTSGDPVFQAQNVVDEDGAPVVKSGHGAQGTYQITPPAQNTAAAMANGNAKTTVTKPDQSTFEMNFNANGRMASLKSSGGGGSASAATAQYEYTNGLISKITYPLGNSISYRYDTDSIVPIRSRPKVKGITRTADGTRGGDPIPEATFSYNEKYSFYEGAVIDFNKNNINYQPTSDGFDVGTITYPGAGTVTLSYNDRGQILSTTHIDGTVTSTTYRANDGFIDFTSAGDLETRYEYNDDPGKRGMPSSIHPPEGADSTLTYNARDELISETRQGTDFSRKLSYDVNGRLIREEAALDGTHSLVDRRVFLQNGFVTNAIQEQVETQGSTQDLVISYEPDQMFRVRKITYPGGQQIKKFEQFDHLGRPHQVTVGDYVEQFDFDLNGNLTSIKRQGAEEKRTYDGYDRLIKIEIPNGQQPESIVTGYYGNGELASFGVVDGQKTNFSQAITIDSYGRPRFVTTASDGGSATTETRYDGSGLTVTIINPLNETTTVTYNAAGQRLTQSDSIREATFDYKHGINLHEVRLAESSASFTQDFEPFSPLNQSTGMSDGEGTIWQKLEPRVDGLLTGQVNARGNRTDITLAKTGEMLARKRQDGMEIDLAFNPNRGMASSKDATAAGHSFAYDSAFRLKTITFRDGSTWDVTAFDLRNNAPTNVNLPGGGQLKMGTDEKGRMRSRNAQFQGDSRQETIDYDALDRVTHATFPLGERTNHYDTLGPIRDETLTIDGKDYKIGRDIRLDGKRTVLRYPGVNGSGVEITEGRDSAGRLTSVLPTGGTPIVRDMPYASAGEVSVHKLGPSGFVEGQTIYDKRKRIIARRYAVPGALNSLADVRYAYDLADNVVVRQYLHRNGRADFFQYDDGERLMRADYGARPTLATAASRTLSGFTVPAEAGGNWSPGFFARNYIYTPANLDFLASAAPLNPDGLALPMFTTNFSGFGPFLETQSTDGFARGTDSLANMTRVHLAVRPRNGGSPALVGATLRYNALSELIGIQRDDGVRIAFDYLDNGLCAYRRIDDPGLPGGVEETVFIYDGPLLLAEYDRTAGRNDLKAQYYYAEGDVPIAAEFADSNGQLHRYYLMQEVNGSIMGLIDENGTVVERYFYDAWGQPEIQPPDTQPPVIDKVITAPNGLFIVFSERVMPPLTIPALPAAHGSPAFANSFALPVNPITLTLNGQPVTGTLRYEESSPSGFGRTFRFEPSVALTAGNMNLTLATALVFDEWNNANPMQTITFKYNPTVNTTDFSRGNQVPTELQPMARSAVGNPFLFHGQYFEYDAGLIYMRARYYDPMTGQFLQRDPFGYRDSVNLYAGFGQNPASFRDPAGTAKIGSRVLGLIEEAGSLLKDAENIGAEVRLGAKLAPEARAAAAASLEVRMARSAARDLKAAERRAAEIANLGELKTGENVARTDVSVAEMQREFDRIALGELDEHQLPQELHRQHKHLFDSIRNASSADELEKIAHRNNIRFMTEAEASAQFRGRLPVRPTDHPWGLNDAANDYRQSIFAHNRVVRAIEDEGFSIANEDVLNAARAGDPAALERLRAGIGHSIGARMIIDVRGSYNAIRDIVPKMYSETHLLDDLIANGGPFE